MSGNRRGVVLRDEGNQLIVDIDGEETPAVLRKTLRRTAGRFRKAVTVGDNVVVESSGEGNAIVEVEERRSYISRPDPSHPRKEQILVANLDAVLVVAAARQPALAPGLIDRFLVAVDRRELEAGIIINKIELDPDRECREIADVYRELDYPVFETSAETGEGLEPLREFLSVRTTSFLGHSGVGKSSLANALDPSLTLRTGEVHEGSGLGTHTTTTVSLLRLPWGGYLVDTPGIREFGLTSMEPHELGQWYREIGVRQQNCRFNDCLHTNEPKCAIKAAVEDGTILRWRYDSYLRVLESLRQEPERY